MRKTCIFILTSLLLILLSSIVLAESAGSQLTPIIDTEDFAPRIWLCKTRAVLDDFTEPGRISNGSFFLKERVNNYAFEGEQIVLWTLVMDKNGIENVKDVHAILTNSQGAASIEANCYNNGFTPTTIYPSCNARIDEENLIEFDPDTMAFFDCIFTVETPTSMYGEYFFTIEAEDFDGLTDTLDENEYWFLNPVVALTINGDLTFENVRPGTDAYSSTVLVGNDADAESGVLLDMFISGTDFYDSSSSGARCTNSNVLRLANFRYFAANGAYSTIQDSRRDAEGYVNIEYGTGFNDPNAFYNNAEIVQTSQQLFSAYYIGNLLFPGSEMAITFKLNLPEPCTGDFDTGSIYFWGEAV